jgi:two-component system OmpR family response regulator
MAATAQQRGRNVDTIRKPSKGVRILVVDDELPITELLQMALTFEGYEVAVASSGRDALTTMQTFRPPLRRKSFQIAR